MSDTTKTETPFAENLLLRWQPIHHERHRGYLGDDRSNTLAVAHFDFPSRTWRLTAAFMPDDVDGKMSYVELNNAKVEADRYFMEWVRKVWPVLLTISQHGGVGETPTTTETARQLELAKQAIHHVLNALCDDPAKYWLMGDGTGSWEKLTKAAAAIYGRTKEEIAARFTPEKPRYDAYCQQHEADLELLRYCQDNGIKVPKE